MNFISGEADIDSIEERLGEAEEQNQNKPRPRVYRSSPKTPRSLACGAPQNASTRLNSPHDHQHWNYCRVVPVVRGPSSRITQICPKYPYFLTSLDKSPATMAAASGSDMALKSFSLTNDIKELSPQDEIYAFDSQAYKDVLRQQPWANDPHYFKSCKISAVALIKMVSGLLVRSLCHIRMSMPNPCMQTSTRITLIHTCFLVHRLSTHDQEFLTRLWV